MDSNVGTVTEAEIASLVDRFYDRVRADDRLGPVFDSAVSDWDQHLQVMRDFWSAMLLHSGRYSGCVMSPHFRLAIAAEDFERWLALFRPSAREALPARQAEQAIAVAEAVAGILQQTMDRG